MLSVIIPCYNEETLVKKSFVEIFKALKDSKITQYEIIFFDDNKYITNFFNAFNFYNHRIESKDNVDDAVLFIFCSSFYLYV